MLKSVAQFKDSVAGILLGVNLNNITAINRTLERAARSMVQHVDIPEASGRENYMIYDGVTDYPAPETIFGGAINDFRPQGTTRNDSDIVYKQGVELFDRTKHYLPNGIMVTFESDKGVAIMRVVETRARQRLGIDSMNDSTEWTVGGTLSLLTDDSTVYYNEAGALRFKLTGAGAGYMERTLEDILDITDYVGVGVQFLAIRTPTASDLSSIEIRLGSSSADYYDITQTEGFLGAWQADEYLLVAFDLSLATEVGTVVPDAVDYLRVTFNHTATITNMRVGGLFMSLPSPYELLFQSAAIFNEDGSLSNTITDENTIIILRDAAYTLYENFAALEIVKGNGRQKMTGKIDELTNTLFNKDTGLVPQYRGDNPSEEIRQTGSYYP